MTKLDVLSGLKKIKIATHYELNGKRLEGLMPARIEELAKCEVKFIEVDGWSENIMDLDSYDKLPSGAKDYIAVIEKELKIPVSWVGTGPKREAMFSRV